MKILKIAEVTKEIIKLAQGKTYQYVPVNPGQTDPNTANQITNINSARDALQDLMGIKDLTDQLMADIAKYEELLGTSAGLQDKIKNIVMQDVIPQTSAFQFLSSKMRYISNSNDLWNQNAMNNILNMINTQITNFQAGQAASQTQTGTMNAMNQMGY